MRSILQCSLLMLAGFLLGITVIRARVVAISNKEAIHAIVMEAAGEGYTGMVAVGEAIRNRGTLKGVVGRRVNRPESVETWDMARRAWKASKHSHLVGGATHWENTKQFGVPKWAANMITTTTIGRHTFYAEK